MTDDTTRMSPDFSVDNAPQENATGQARLFTLAVGLGASAGGLQALQAFFKAMPPDSGMAFVLVQRLDPDHPSTLAEIVAESTVMPVTQAKTGDALAPNHVFVIKPGAVMTLSRGILDIACSPTDAMRQTSIDASLASLAEDQGENAIAVILAGFGSAGAMGLESIREHGGLTFAQAEFDHSSHDDASEDDSLPSDAPRTAVAGGVIDRLLPVAQIPAALLRHAAYRNRSDAKNGADGLEEDVGGNLGVICAILNSRMGRDFSSYKTRTLMRRVQRRMAVLQCDDVAEYIEQLREQPDEPEQLFREFLIRVTNFFRDHNAFDAVARRIPELLSQDAGKDTRIWIPGCATGEEAYTLAILFQEALSHAGQSHKVQIFATDLDDQAIRIARTGRYPESIAADIPAALLERYFVKENGEYRVSRPIRDICLFSTHDLVKDPPFSRLSLISCRNLLIYFAPALQKRVVTLFHHGLRAGGLLLLGTSEAVAADAGLFSTVDKKHRIFRRKSAPAHLARLPAPPLLAPAREVRAAADNRVAAQIARVISRYAPAFVVMDRRQNIQQFSGPVGKYLAPNDGVMSMNLGLLLHPQLRGPLRAALKQMTATQQAVVGEEIALAIAGHTEVVSLAVELLKDGAGSESEDLVIVVFQNCGPIRAAKMTIQDDVFGEDPAGARRYSRTPVELLEISPGDLQSFHDEYQSSYEEYQAVNEELQSANEELQSTNEELQSTNEELETSKEELQSINEELTTLNSELNARNDSLVELNDDLTNLIDSTSIATLFLDEKLSIRRFTPALLDIFRVREGDQGRPIIDIVSRLKEDGLSDDAAEVLNTLEPLQRQVSLKSGDRSFQMEIRPYRGTDDVIGGVVITFVDITDRDSAEKARASLAAIVDASDDAIIGHDLNGVIVSWNASAVSLFGYTEEEAIGHRLALILRTEDNEKEQELLDKVHAGERIGHHDTRHLHKNSSVIEVSQSVAPIRTSGGEIIGAARIVRSATKRADGEREKIAAPK
ncbi:MULTISPECIES: CheR family methyltransferase [unclassified Achromobacter]|uniref:CheR family methyltransferase n=1 Tax=unclassified Achromobacter TaxID=2626865 RepID=UPI000B514C62|nr:MULTISPECIES: CheR family methyltransferase [unclassified Achromobacter]OWT80786.1 SAM-dependent methyltransferase [Achromobacter sp. HZ34]OWT81302.1 SAM-dependent methyltransferase [Achromobacter sp. HZ28]